MAKKAKETTVIDTSGYDYGTLRGRDPDGKMVNSRGNCDAVHRALFLYTKINGKDIMTVARANKIEVGDHANNGQVSMAIGQSLRAKVKADEPVTIGSVTVKKLDQRDPILPKVEEVERAAPKAKAAKQPKGKKRKAKRQDDDQAEAA